MGKALLELSSFPFRMGLTIPTLLIWKETQCRWNSTIITTNRKSSKPCLKELKVPEKWGCYLRLLHLAWAKMTHATLVCTVIAEIIGFMLECLEPTAHLSRENRMSQEQTLASSFFFFFLCGPFTYWSEAKFVTAPCFLKVQVIRGRRRGNGRKVVKSFQL